MSSYLVVRHVFSTTASRPNAGADGLQKTHFLGGAERARISEQCLRRALLDGGVMLPLAGQSVRTRQVATLVADRLKATGVADGPAAEAGKVVAAVLSKGARGAGGDTGGDGADEAAGEEDAPAEAAAPAGGGGAARKAKMAVLAIAREEYDGLAALAKRHLDAGTRPAKLAKAIEKDLKEVMRGGAMALDAKLFGRMVSGVPEARSTGCLGNTAAVGTHPVEDFLDTFVAVDRHAPLEHGAGAGHFDERHHTGSVFVADWWLDARLAGEHGIDPLPVVEGLVRGLAALVIRPLSGKTAVPLETAEIAVEERPHGSFGPSAEAFRVPCAPTAEAAVGTLQAWLERRDRRLGGPLRRHWLGEDGLEALCGRLKEQRAAAA